MTVIKNTYLFWWGLAGWDVAYIATLFWIFLHRGKVKRLYFVLFLPSILGQVILFNPVIAEKIESFVYSYAEYSRFLWILLMVPVIAYGVVQLIIKQRKKWISYVLLVGCMVTTILTYGDVLEVFEEKENVYKIPEYVLEVDGIMQSTAKKSMAYAVSIEWDKNTYDDVMSDSGNMYYGLQQYDGDLDVEFIVEEAILESTNQFLISYEELDGLDNYMFLIQIDSFYLYQRTE